MMDRQTQASGPSIYEVEQITRKQRESDERDAARYRFLRERDTDTIHKGGIFVGITPDNTIVTGVDLDRAIDDHMAKGD